MKQIEKFDKNKKGRFQSIEDRFWSKVQIKGDDDCWLWLGSKDRHGYGYFQLGVGIGCERSHRMALCLTLGRWLASQEHVLHNCPKGDNPSCVNPKHLRIGTHKDNMNDAAIKQQIPNGERHYNSKLTKDKVREIRRRYTKGNYTQQQLADEFGVGLITIYDILRFKTWRRV